MTLELHDPARTQGETRVAAAPPRGALRRGARALGPPAARCALGCGGGGAARGARGAGPAAAVCQRAHRGCRGRLVQVRLRRCADSTACGNAVHTFWTPTLEMFWPRVGTGVVHTCIVWETRAVVARPATWAADHAQRGWSSVGEGRLRRTLCCSARLRRSATHSGRHPERAQHRLAAAQGSPAAAEQVAHPRNCRSGRHRGAAQLA